MTSPYLALAAFCGTLIVVDGRGRQRGPPLALSEKMTKRYLKRTGGEIDEEAATLPDTLRIYGDLPPACASSLAFLNTDFVKQGVTADNKSYYQSKDGSAHFLYFDKNCDGTGGFPPLWIFDVHKPSTTAVSVLNGDATCNTTGHLDFALSSAFPPKNAMWAMQCEGFGPWLVHLTIAWYGGWHVCPPGSFCNGDGCPSNNAASIFPRDRWDPKKVRATSCCYRHPLSY